MSLCPVFSQDLTVEVYLLTVGFHLLDLKLGFLRIRTLAGVTCIAACLVTTGGRVKLLDFEGQI